VIHLKADLERIERWKVPWSHVMVNSDLGLNSSFASHSVTLGKLVNLLSFYV
jgi:hypothetical protein